MLTGQAAADPLQDNIILMIASAAVRQHHTSFSNTRIGLTM